MLTLTPDLYIGRGYHRECYIHPDQPDRCVKVVVNGDDSETKRELGYYHKLIKRNIDWSMLPKFHAQVNTNKGEGVVFDLVLDYSGKVSKPLSHYLDSVELTANHAKALPKAFLQFSEYLLSEKILTMTIKPKNILYKLTSATEGHLVLVDNIGNSDFLPVCDYSSFFARLKIARKLSRFQKLLLKQYPNNTVLHSILKK